MTQGSASLLARADSVADFDDDFSLDLRVVVASHPISDLTCPTDDGCGSTCSGSACSSIAEHDS